jgi:hypothetical protein
MAMERQTNFAAGRLAPTLHGRTDLNLYGAGCRELLNFFATQHGTVENRAGFQYLGTESAYFRLIPWVYSDTTARLLMFTPTRLVAYEYDDDGKVVVGTTKVTAADGYPYTTNLDTLRVAQVGRVMTIVSRYYAPYELIDTDGNGTYEFSEISFDVPEYPSEASVGHVYLTRAWGGNNINGDSTHPTRAWDYKVTRVMRGEDGYTYETKAEDYARVGDSYTDGADTSDTPSAGAAPLIGDNLHAIYADYEQALGWRVYSDALTSFPKLVSTRIYRGRGGEYGYVGEVEAPYRTSIRATLIAVPQYQSQWFIDSGADPDYSNPPPSERNPFDDEDAGNPSCVTFFEGRRYFSGCATLKTRVFGSAVENYANFDEVIPPDDADSIEFELGTMRGETIRAMVSKRNLFLFTTGGEWIVTGTQQEGLVTPNSIAVRRLSDHGSTGPEPILIGYHVLFVASKGSRPMAMALGGDSAGRAIDISLPAKDLFDGHTITDWAYARDPHSIVWCVRDDGLLLSLTYNADLGVAAWAKHEIAGGGVVSAVTVVPEGQEDVLYASIERDGSYLLTRVCSRTVTDARYSRFLDFCTLYDGQKDVRGAIDSTPVGTLTISAVDIDQPAETDWSCRIDISDDATGELDGGIIQVVHPTSGGRININLVWNADHYDCTLNEILTNGLFDADLEADYDDWYICAESVGVPNAVWSDDMTLHRHRTGWYRSLSEATGGCLCWPEIRL